ncbi:hypothetical protein [Haploplasma axanthum]|uniref:Uncharacterized protein n=2 Tax=Haploplasma axanthum TaxID=29552 RepID=A0A449BB42_HAPAX|nr:hypothetical protein [Haploplasma axanthum]VEU79554.1 Uncharacterised protein [Haploplasma axanthum]VEU81363.1 Uncharacterised protein [Haploplasma axanthum]
MIKKILIIIFIGVASFLLATPKLYAAETAKPSPSIEITDITRNQNTITIQTNETDLITHAVVEYVFLENTQRISMLKTYDVKNNTFTIESKITDLKIWQLKKIRKETSTLHMTSGKNTIGTIENVERRNISEIETVASNIVDTGLFLDKNTGKHIGPGRLDVKLKYFEFYFKFEKTHDKVISIDVNYVFGDLNYDETSLINTENISERIFPDGVEIEGYEIIWDAINYSKNTFKKLAVRGLDNNFIASIDANYVTRVFPIKNAASNIERRGRGSRASFAYGVSNFAIIKIQYMVDGVFFEDDVINPPVDPVEPVTPEDTLGWLQELIAKIKEIIQKLKDAWGKYSTIVLTVIYILIVYICYRILKACWGLIQLPFKLLKVLFIPKKK